MRLVIVAFVVLAALAATPAAAQMVTGFHVLPVAVHAPGVPPSFWQSDVFVANYGSYPMEVGFLFFPEGQANSLSMTVPPEHTRTVASRQTLLVEDVVHSLFGYDSRKGMLWVVSDTAWFPENAPDPEKLIVTSRTYNTGGDPRGTFGQSATNTLPFLNFESVSSWVTGARLDGTFRCNLGIGSWGPTTITVHYRVLRDDGTGIGQGAREIPSWSMGQWSLASLGVAETPGPLSIELWLDPANVTADYCADLINASGFFAYVSPVDGAHDGEGTGDSEITYAIPGDDLQINGCER